MTGRRLRIDRLIEQNVEDRRRRIVEQKGRTSPRVGPRSGVIVTGTVARSDLLAYLTSRAEDEVIVDPEDVAIDDLVGSHIHR